MKHILLTFGLILLMSTNLITSELVNIQKKCPRIILDIRYATTNNFTRHQVYSSASCFLQESTAQKLCRVQEELETMGLGLKIFDGYRPLSVQKIFWNLVPDERYVGNPAKGSKHNRGSAVDCTLVTKDGKELAMPTEFDNFTERAHRTFMNLPTDIIKNRELLERVMTKHGFVGLPTEWWHFDDTDWQQYPILDISFEELS